MAENLLDLDRMLEGAWDDAPEGANTFRDQIRIYEKAADALISGGTVSTISAGPRSQSYSPECPPAQVARNWTTIRRSYDRCRANIEDAGGDATEEAIKAEMRENLGGNDPIPDSYQIDHSEARLCV